jgi:hypothetical protein
LPVDFTVAHSDIMLRGACADCNKSI